MESSSQDKNLPATAQRLKKARADGHIARSKDLSNLAVLGGGAVVLMALLPMGFEMLRGGLQQQLRFDHGMLQQPQLVLERLTAGFGQGLMIYLPLGLLVVAIAIVTAIASGSWALSTKPIMPDITRLNPLSGIGRLFSKQQLVETAKLAGITAVVGVVAWRFIASHVQPFSTLLMRPLEGALGQLGSWMGTGVGLLLLVVLFFALVDLPLQKFLHASRMKMSLEEVKREHKENEGDPHMKGKRRQRQRELAQRNSVGAVPRASQVPVLQAPMLARALYAHAEIDGEVPSALYTAVAQVLAYVYQLKAALKGQGVMPGEMPVPQVPPELDPHWKKPATETTP